MSTPAYFPPVVTAAGLAVPSYAAILADNVGAFLNIYGTNQYVAPDSAIYQLLSIISLKQSDTCAAAQLAYNQSSPQTAVGAGLDRQVKMNGLAREPVSFSTALLTVTATPLLVITNGVAQDQSGNLWALPTSVALPNSGFISVQATCTTPGAVSAEPGQINIISTPQNGWTSVSNAAAAETGLPVEPDSSLRARQAISVSLPSVTPIAATIAAILAMPGVARVAPGFATPGGPGTSIENPTGATDSWGNPPHSISLVVQCTNTQTVAAAIYAKKTLGCFTNGTTTVPVIDPTTGVTIDISFFLPTNLAIAMLVKIAGYGNTPTSATLSSVQTALNTYLNELAIGETVSIGALYAEAMAVNLNLSQPSFGVQSIQLGVQAVVTSSTYTLAATTITVASASGIASGQLVSGSGIDFGTLVVGAPAGDVVTLSLPTIAASASGGTDVGFTTLGATDVPMTNFNFAALGEPLNISVVRA